jgi:hypothetical protein
MIAAKDPAAEKGSGREHHAPRSVRAAAGRDDAAHGARFEDEVFDEPFDDREVR